MKWLKRFFTKSEIRELSFYNGTDGMKKHSEFIDWVNENDVEIINSYITYHKYDYSHIPRYINYVIKIKRGMKKSTMKAIYGSALVLATLAILTSCEPVTNVGRVMVWTVESGATVVDTIAPTALFNEATDVANSRFDLNLSPSDDAILDTVFTYLY